MLVLFREVPAFFDQPPHPHVTAQIERIHPGQLLPHLKVPQVVHAEPPRGSRRILTASPPRAQFRVPRVDTDHPRRVRVKEILDDEGDVGRRERVRRLETQIEDAIRRTIRRKCLELHEQRRHQVEGDPDRRELPKQLHHAEIVLERMEAHPRQDVLPRHEILVVRLVHVPDECDLGHSASLLSGVQVERPSSPC